MIKALCWLSLDTPPFPLDLLSISSCREEETEEVRYGDRGPRWRYICLLLQIESTAMWTADCPLTYVYRLKKIQPSITGIARTGKRFPQETGKHKRLYTHTYIFNVSCLTSVKKVYTCTATCLYLVMCLYVRASVRMNNSSRSMLSAEASAPDRGWKIHARLAGRRPMRDHRRRVEKREKTVEKVTSG